MEQLSVGEGLKVLGVTAGRLAERPKGMAEKQVLAWWLRRRTTMGRRWVSERLWMGEESGVSRKPSDWSREAGVVNW
jgi:hypothetical protein